MRLNSFRTALTAAIIFCLVTVGFVAPTYATGETVTLNRDDVVVQGSTNPQQLVVFNMSLPATITSIKIDITGALLPSSGSGSWTPITTSSSGYTNCGTTTIGINSGITASGSCLTSNSVVNGQYSSYILWDKNTNSGNVGNQISFAFPAGSLTFDTNGAYEINVFLNGIDNIGRRMLYPPRTNQAPLTVTSTTGTLGTPLPLTTSGGSGVGAVTYTTTNGTATGCAITAGKLSATTTGTCMVTATKGQDSSYNAVSSLATAVTIRPAQSTITVTSTSGVFATPLTLTSTGGSGTGNVTYTTTNGTASGCAVTSGNLSSTSAGTCLVTATKAGDGDYDAASSTATTVSIAKAPRTLSFGATTSYTLAYGSTQTVVATPDAGVGSGAITYSISSGTACSVGSSTGIISVTASTGSCVVSASIAESTSYLSAQTTTQISVNGTVRAITVRGGSPSVNFGTTYTPTGLVTSGSLVGAQTVDHSQTTFTFVGTSGTSYGPTTVMPLDAGHYSVTPSNLAISGGSASDYNITYAAGLLTINKVGRSLSFATTSYSLAYGETQTVVLSSYLGDGAVTYSAGNSNACTVNPTTGLVAVSQGTGTCEISATIAEGTNHLTATTTTPVTITVSKRVITVSASSPSVTFGGTVAPTFSVTTGSLANSDAISGVTYTYAGNGYASSTSAPSVIGAYTVSPSAALFSTGNVANYTVTYAPGTLTILNKTSRTLSFATTSYSLEYGDNQTVGALASAGSSDGTISYSPGSSSACSVDTTTGVVNVTASSGTCEITATISEGTSYLAATTATAVTITVSPRTITITAASPTVSYGSSVSPSYSVTSGTLQGSDTISGVRYVYSGTGSTSYATSSTAPTSGGTYSVVPSAAAFSSGSASNYAITYLPGALTINQSREATAGISISASVGMYIAGTGLTFNASGLEPTASYDVTVRSTPQILARGNAVGGSVSSTAIIPSGLEAGWHTLTFSSTAADGSAVTESIYFKLSGAGILLSTTDLMPAELAMTGMGATPTVISGAALVLLGALVVVLSAYRRRKML